MIIFLHGYGSSGKTSSTGKTIRNILSDVEVVCFTYNYHDPSKSAQDILTQLQKLNLADVELVVGVSLGGFWARWLANRINVPLVLINPSLQPQLSLHCRPDFNENLLKEFDNYSVKCDVPELPITVILGTKDDVVSPEHAIKTYTNRARLVLVEGAGHKLTHDDMSETLTQAFNTVYS